MAAGGGHIDIVKYFVDKGADINIKDESEVSLYKHLMSFYV